MESAKRRQICENQSTRSSKAAMRSQHLLIAQLMIFVLIVLIVLIFLLIVLAQQILHLNPRNWGDGDAVDLDFTLERILKRLYLDKIEQGVDAVKSLLYCNHP